MEYQGHVVSKEGNRPVLSKVEAIVNAPTPANVSQLRFFLGLQNCYGKFIPNLSSLLHPLNVLLRTRKRWHWSQVFPSLSEGQRSNNFGSGPHALQSTPTNHPSSACFSLWGWGCHIACAARPLRKINCFASHILTTSESNYLQLEREALSLILAYRSCLLSSVSLWAKHSTSQQTTNL